MEDNFLVSLVNTLKTGSGRYRTAPGGEQNEPDLFSKVLEEQTRETDQMEERRSAEEKTISSDRTREEETQKAARREKETKEGKTDNREAELSPLKNYLYNLVLKDRDAMSLGEQKLMGLDRSLSGKVDLRELRMMLARRGMAVTDLSSEQIFKLTKMHEESQVTAFLDQLAREHNLMAKREQRAEPGAAGSLGAQETVASQARQARPNEMARPDQAGLSQEAKEARQAVKREEVIQQILSHIEMQQIGDKTQLTLKLNPEYLGQLKVQFQREDGQLRASFETSSALVRDLLNDSVDELSGAMKEQGVTLHGVSVRLVEERDFA